MSDPDLYSEIESLLTTYTTASSEDPFTNPYLRFALHLTQRMAAGDVRLDALRMLIADIAADGFLARADRLRIYLDHPNTLRDTAALKQLFEGLADRGFDEFATALSRPALGVVTTSHPTFALNEEFCTALVEMASGETATGENLSEEDRKRRRQTLNMAQQGPPSKITLDVEHAWSVRALTNALDALREARLLALRVALKRWPTQWATLKPRMLTLATWVGFDQDGRTDVTWLVSVGKRLQLKQAALSRMVRHAAAIGDGAIAVKARLDKALDAVTTQLDAFNNLGDDTAKVADFSRIMIDNQSTSLADPSPLLDDIVSAIAQAGDEEAQIALIALAADVETHGVCLAHIHVRLNAAQLHNAVRREVGLETSPADPANRRTYFAAINQLIGDCRPVEVGFQTLLSESASAKALFITIAQMKKFIDAQAPVRFLIAETESGFTLLAALYYARLFGVEDIVQISPLFETEEALARGETVIEEALKSPHFRKYLQRQGKLCIEFGFSDSGRFIGQMAATFRIERLRLRLAELMEREGLTSLEIVLFNTHGESLGRGGHPASLQDRLAYCAPAQSRQEFAKRGIRVREEDSFQGGDGYLPLFTPAVARATVRGLLQFSFAQNAETHDPIYDRPDFASDFFATIQQSFDQLAEDHDYLAFLSLYGTRLLNKTGSRPEQRQSQGTAAVRTFAHVSELRAIPNNGILQGMGCMANTTVGVARAAAKDPETFAFMIEHSQRFGRALEMARIAATLSDLPATRAYAATADPGLWLDRRTGSPSLDAVHLETLTSLSEKAGLTASLSQILRRLRSEPFFPLPICEDQRRGRVRLLHAVRVTIIQCIALISARLPTFTPSQGVTLSDVQLQLLRLEITSAVEFLKQRFPIHVETPGATGDFGETPTYDAVDAHGYAYEYMTLFDPLLQLHGLLLQTTTALDHEMGACG